MRKLALMLLATAFADDGLHALVEDLRKEAADEFAGMRGIEATERGAYVEAFVADGLAAITQRVVEVDPDGRAREQFEWVRGKDATKPTVATVPCPAAHRCGTCGRASLRAFASPFEAALLVDDALDAAPSLFHQRGKTSRTLDDVGLPAVASLARRALQATEAAFNASLILAGGLLVRISAVPDGDLAAPAQKPYWESHIDRENQETYDYSALVYFEDGGVAFGGGSLMFADSEEILPRRGRLVAFSSGTENEHRVERVSRGARTALALWFACDA